MPSPDQEKEALVGIDTVIDNGNCTDNNIKNKKDGDDDDTTDDDDEDDKKYHQHPRLHRERQIE